jgi:hypothetical protein
LALATFALRLEAFEARLKGRIGKDERRLDETPITPANQAATPYSKDNDTQYGDVEN